MINSFYVKLPDAFPGPGEFFCVFTCLLILVGFCHFKVLILVDLIKTSGAVQFYRPSVYTIRCTHCL